MNSDQQTPPNPFAAPTADIGVQPETDLTPEETVRNEYLRHEHNIKSIGTLFLIFSVISGLMTGSGILVLFAASASSDLLTIAFTIGLFATVFAAQVSAGIGLRRLAPWSRIPAALVSMIMTIGVPIGTILGVIFLYLLFSKKSKYVFSEEYRNIVALTPHIKLKTSRLLVAVLLILIAVLVIAIGGAFLSMS